MKILHVADLHLNPGWFDWIAEEAHRFDLIAIGGDLLNAFSGRSMGNQVNAVSKRLIKLDCATVICSGNHDYWLKSPRVKGEDRDAEAAWVKRLKGQGKIIGVDGDVITFQPKYSEEE